MLYFITGSIIHSYIKIIIKDSNIPEARPREGEYSRYTWYFQGIQLPIGQEDL